MAFTTPVWRNWVDIDEADRVMRLLRFGLLLLMACQSFIVLAEDFEIPQLSARLLDGIYSMDADIDYRFSEQALEALHNGVPLTLEVHVQLRRAGAWVWEKDLFELRLRYQFRYHALAELYQVIDLQSGTEQDFVTRSAALSALGKIRGVSLIEQEQLEPEQSYALSVQTALDIEALPLPLRPLAYLTPAWSLSSETKTWYLRP